MPQDSIKVQVYYDHCKVCHALQGSYSVYPCRTKFGKISRVAHSGRAKLVTYNGVRLKLQEG